MEYRCEKCKGYLFDGQKVILTTVIESVKDKRLGKSVIYHSGCFVPPL